MSSSDLVQRLQTWARQPRVQHLALAVVLTGFAVQAATGARTMTPTPDEFVYVPTGYYHLRTGDSAFEPSNPPLLKMAAALPLLAMHVQLDLDPRWRDTHVGWGAWLFGTRFMQQNRANYLQLFFAARLVMVAIGIGLGALVFFRARQLLSPVGALATLILYGTTPTLVAHAGVATLDVGVTALVFAALCALERYATTRAVRWAVATGVCLGLAVASKGVALLFLPLVPFMLAFEWRTWTGAAVRRFVVGTIVIGLGAWAAVTAAYGASGFPLPAPFIVGLRFQLGASRAGEFPAFLNGAWSSTGWWYYYLEAFMLKTPLPTLVLTLAGLFVIVRRGLRAPGDLWLLVPSCLLLYVLSFHYEKNYGVRYLLPVIPFLLIVAGRGIDALLEARTWGAGVMAALLGWQVVACAASTPYQLAYFNELAGGSDHARRLLLDSNLDWGQDLGRVKSYMDSRGVKSICLGYFGHVDPHVYGIDYRFPPTAPAPGLCAISANFLAGYPYAITYAGERVLSVPATTWTWFDRLQPVARIGRSIYVFDVTPEDVARLR